MTIIYNNHYNHVGTVLEVCEWVERSALHREECSLRTDVSGLDALLPPLYLQEGKESNNNIIIIIIEHGINILMGNNNYTSTRWSLSCEAIININFTSKSCFR